MEYIDNIGIENIVRQYEEKYNINVFFLCDTGSRTLGVAAESSDYDLNGFFIPHYKEYLKICRKSPIIIHKMGLKFENAGKECQADIQLWDIRDWFKEKIVKNNLGCDFWFESTSIFRNNHPEVINKIKSKLEPPFYYFWGKYKNTYDLCQKDIKKGGTQNKKIMNNLIYAVQYLHCRILEGFPKFNIFEEIEIFRSKKEEILSNKSLDESEYDNLIKCFEYIEICYEEKKKSKTSETPSIPDFVKSFVTMLDKKFNAKAVKLDVQNPWDENNSQEIFDKLLLIYKKL